MHRPVEAVRAGALVALLACGVGACGDEARQVVLVRIAPVADPGCGAPLDAQTMLVTALGDFPGGADTRSLPIEAGAGAPLAFPPGTRVVKVEIIGTGEGFRRIGQSAPFRIDELDDGAELPVFMAPPRGFCPTGPPLAARVAPLAARAGSGVLVGGGLTAAGEPVHGLEWYEPSTGAFVPVNAERLYGDGPTGLLGATMTPLPDGRVVIAGGGVPAYQVFHPGDRALASALFLRRVRAYHAAVALDERRLLLAGGCGILVGGACDPASALASTTILDVETGDDREGPALQRARIGAVAVLEADGAIVLVGGVDGAGAPVTQIERLDLDAGTTTSIEGGGAAVARLAAGSLLTAFAPAGAAPSSSAGVWTDAEGLSPVTAAMVPRAGASLTALQDGTVVALGGAAGPALYVPFAEQFTELSAVNPPPARTGHAAVALDDGTVLLVGGAGAGGEALDDAWIFRPDLTGPYTPSLAASFGDAELARHVVPLDPARAENRAAAEAAPAHYRLRASGAAAGALDQWAVLGGPRAARGSLTATVRLEGAGRIVVLLPFRGPRDYRAVVLEPGAAPALVEVAGGVATSVDACEAVSLEAEALAPAGGGAVALEVGFGADGVEVSLGERVVLTCQVPPGDAGSFGIGVGGEAGTVLRVDLLIARRG